MSGPTAAYTSPDKQQSFSVGPGPHSTNGSTTQISDIVLKAGGVDRDKPTEAKDTYLGGLRGQLTNLQDQVNVFLTDRMAGKKSAEDEEIERRILDEGAEEDSD